MHRGEEDRASAFPHLMTSILIGAGAALLTAFVVLLLCSVATVNGWLKQSMTDQIVIAACVLGVLLGGRIAIARQRHARTLLVGLGTGCVLFLLLLTVSVFFYQDASLTENGLGLLCACLCGGAFSGILGGRPNKKRRK